MYVPKCKIYSFIKFSNTDLTQITFIQNYRPNGRCSNQVIPSGHATLFRCRPPELCSLAEEFGRRNWECYSKQHNEDWVVQRTLSSTLERRSVGFPTTFWCLTFSNAGNCPQFSYPRCAILQPVTHL